MTYPLDSKKIRLNPDSDFLNCSNSFYTKTCIVPLSHFQGKNNGYFNTYYSFEYNNSLITNESILTIKDIFDEDLFEGKVNLF